MVIAIIVLSVMLVVAIVIGVKKSITYRRESMAYTAVCMSHNILSQFLVCLNDVLDKNIILNALTNAVKMQENKGLLKFDYDSDKVNSNDVCSIYAKEIYNAIIKDLEGTSTNVESNQA